MDKPLDTRRNLGEMVTPKEMQKIPSRDPSGYEGPGKYATPSGDALSGAYAVARAKAIYEAHGRNGNAIARMRMDPSYAAARAAGIQLPGDGMMGTRDGNDKLLGGGTGGGLQDVGAMYRSATGAGPVATAFYGSDGKQMNPYSGPTSEVSPSPTGAQIEVPQGTGSGQGVPSNAPKATTGSGTQIPDAITKFGEDPKPQANAQEQKTTPVNETSKGPRLDTDRGQKPNTGTTRDYLRTRGQTAQQGVDAEYFGPNGGNSKMQSNMAARDKINKESLRGGSSGITERQASEAGFGSGTSDRVLDNSDASVKMMRAKERNDLQDQREAINKEYNSKSAAAYREDEFKNKQAGWQTEKGDTEIEQRTGEVQDRSIYDTPVSQALGQGRVKGREIVYSGKDGSRSPDAGPLGGGEKEMVKNTVGNAGTYTRNSNGSYSYQPAADSVMIFPSATQNKRDAMTPTDARMGAKAEASASTMSDAEKYVGGSPTTETVDSQYRRGAGAFAGAPMGDKQFTGPLPQPATKPSATTATYDYQKGVDNKAGEMSAGSNYSGKEDRGVQSPELIAQSKSASSQGGMNALNTGASIDLAPINDKAEGYKGPQSEDPKKKKQTNTTTSPSGKEPLPV